VSASTGEGTGAAHLSIGEVLGVLREEFPDVTISKIRFLESQGLIDPERTPSGYRKFYEADVSRLRWILHQQKDHFLPLKVIKERLDQLDDGEAAPPPDGADGRRAPAVEPAAEEAPAKPGRAEKKSPRRPRVISEPELPLVDLDADAEPEPEPAAPARGARDARDEAPAAPRRDVSLTRKELARAAGLTDWQLGELESYGLLSPASRSGEHGLFDEQDLAIAKAAAGFGKLGIEARHLRMYKHFADRETALFEQVLVQLLRQRNPAARAKAQEEFTSLARLGRQLRAALLVQTMRDSLAE
jgi:DNA-binding transcriptional MerR regulator